MHGCDDDDDLCAMILDKLDGIRRATGAEAGVCEALA